VIIVREIQTSYRSRRIDDDGITGRTITGPEVAARILAAWPACEDGARLDCSTVERFYVLALDTKHRITHAIAISVGTLDATIVHPREVFRAAILANAAAIIVAHNHPSGDPTPSGDDQRLTDRLSYAAGIIGINFIDHLIIGTEGRYWSHTKGAASHEHTA
jgi:DNA repair protein RadC